VLKNSSYLFNLIYWRLFRIRDREALSHDHWDTLQRAYADKEIWARHCQDLEMIIKQCRLYNAELVVLIFPHLSDIEKTKKLTAQVADFFQSRHVPVLDMGFHLQERNVHELTVSHLDCHPSEALNREIAQLLYREINRLGVVKTED
jgi:hypothetical protein